MLEFSQPAEGQVEPSKSPVGKRCKSMSDDIGQWQWVDVDPFEKLLGERKDSTGSSPAKFPSDVDVIEPAREENLWSYFPNAGAESGRSTENLDPSASSQNREHGARLPGDLSFAAGWRVADIYSASVIAEPDALNIHFDRAVSLQELEQWEAAADSFRQVLQIDSSHANALIGVGDCLLHLDCLDEALNCFERCLLSETEREKGLLGKAVALQKLARYEEADQAYRELFQLSPDSIEVLENLIALSVARRDTRAITNYSSRLLQLEPYSKAALQGLATVAIWGDDQPGAVDYCTRLVEVDPISFEAWHNLGFAMKRMRLFDQRIRSIA